MKILHLSGRPAWCGESNRVLVECAGLKRAGHEVVLGTSPRTAIGARARELGIEVVDTFNFAKGFRPRALMRDVRTLRQLVRARAFDIVHLHTSRDTWPAALALGNRGRTGRPLLVKTKHNDLPIRSNVHHRWLYGSRIDVLILAGARLIEGVSDLIADRALDSARLPVLHSSVDVHRFDPARVDPTRIRREFGLDGCFVIGLVGRVSREKGHELLLAALRDRLAEDAKLRLLMVGEGDQLERLRSETQRDGWGGRVIWTGARRDIPDLVSAMDVLVMPSLWLDASPAVVKEAMALGVPVVASRVGGTAEIVRDGVDGLLIEPGSESSLREALSRLRDASFRQSLGATARDRVIQEFSDEQLVARSIALYTQLLGRR